MSTYLAHRCDKIGMLLIEHFSESAKCRCYQFQTQNRMQIEYYKDQNYL